MAIGRVPGATGIQPSIVDAKGDLIAATAADSVSRLAVGSNEQRLVADSSQATGLKYVADTTNYAIAAKGDLLVGTAADTLSALTVGTNGHTLVADSSTATGLKWAAPSTASFVGCSLTRSAVATSFTTNVFTKIPFATEEFDTDAFHDNSTNNSRITIPSGKNGKYLITFFIYLPGVSGYVSTKITKNNADLTGNASIEISSVVNGNDEAFSGSTIIDAVATDYFELEARSAWSTGNKNISARFSAQYLGA